MIDSSLADFSPVEFCIALILILLILKGMWELVADVRAACALARWVDGDKDRYAV